MADYEGIVVLGVPRSGTTLMRRLLDAHPRIACGPESNLLSAASRFLEETEFAGGLSVGAIPGLGFCGFEEDEILERFREFLFQFWRESAARAGKPRWAEKTAVDIFHLDAIERLCGHRCRYICLVRHPLDVVCSLKELSDKMESYLPELFTYVQRHPGPLEAFAHAWVDANRRLLRFTTEHPAWCLRLRYEDLIEHPMEELSRVFEFLGEPTGLDALLTRGLGGSGSVGLGDWKTYGMRSLSGQSLGRHAALSKWTLRRLTLIVEPLMGELGYDTKGLLQKAPVPDSRRLQELGRFVANLKISSSSSSNPDA